MFTLPHNTVLKQDGVWLNNFSTKCACKTSKNVAFRNKLLHKLFSIFIKIFYFYFPFITIIAFFCSLRHPIPRARAQCWSLKYRRICYQVPIFLSCLNIQAYDIFFFFFFFFCLVCSGLIGESAVYLYRKRVSADPQRVSARNAKPGRSDIYEWAIHRWHSGSIIGDREYQWSVQIWAYKEIEHRRCCPSYR